jgi:predicted AlkP superfamily phosphohydrolase/phosphomutase
MKLLVIGLDGMTFDVIDPLIKMKHLPNIARLMREGIRSPLLSTVPSRTPVAWSSFVTGKSPGDHGVYAWGIKTADYRMSIINANYLRDQSIWTILHRAGKKIGVVGLPMSYPPERYPSFMVGGPLSPSVHSAFTFPESLYQEVKENVGEYIIDYDKRQQLAEGEEPFVASMTRMARARGETTLYLMRAYPWDVLTAVFIAPDRLQHCLWPHLNFVSPMSRIQERIIEFYDLIDDYIGKMVEATPNPKTVIILSDHGFGPGRRKVSLNGWLMRQGYLNQSRSSEFGSLRQQLVALANRVGLTRERLKRWLSQMGMLDQLGDQIDGMSTYEMAFDWQRSVAFAGGPGIYLNVVGREREGIVSPGDEYEGLRKEISEGLSQLQDPQSGEPVFVDVCYREQFYTGRRVDMAPDIIPVPRDGFKVANQFYEEGSHSIREDVFEDPQGWTQGMHRRAGVLIAWGPQINRTAHLQEPAYIWDLAPTLLGLSGIPVPTDMTGRVLTELLKPEFAQSVRRVDAAEGEHEGKGLLWAGDDDEQVVEERLRGLGYLE